MSTTSVTLPQLLGHATARRTPADFERLNVSDLRKPARLWVGPDQSKLAKEPLIAALRQALNDDQVADRVLKSLSPAERAVAAVYRRYGGTVNGEVIRLDLMTRGLLEKLEKQVSDYYTQRRWKRNLVRELAERWVLLSSHGDRDSYYYYSYSGYGDEPDRAFPLYSLHPGLAGLIEPAEPPPWSVAPAEGVPQAITQRAAAEVALDLSRIFRFVAARGSVKVRKDGILATPTLRALEKAVPLGEDSEFWLPEPHGLLFELLRYAGAVRVEGNAAVADPAAATRMFDQPEAWLAYSWARAWLTARHWNDGVGAPETYDLEDREQTVQTARQVLAWGLGALAHAGDHWYALETFLAALDSFEGNALYYLPLEPHAWNPKLSSGKPGPARLQRPGVSDRKVAWFANALMVTLVALGLVERGRLGRAANAPYAFRLTGLGRAVFGAPEIAAPASLEERRFLVVQPNFDLLAYVDQADASSAGLLGRFTESDSAHSGPVQTFRITQGSIYQAQESGLTHEQIVAFLEKHAQGALPANVERSLADWTGKRESLVLRSGATLLGFPTETDRDAYLKRHPGTACGTRFAFAGGPKKERSKLPGALAADHLSSGRRTLVLDEHGTMQARQPLDVVQRARLLRIAAPVGDGWQLSGDSIRLAAAAGLKPALVQRWLLDHLAEPMPPLISQAIDAWMGKAERLEMAEAVLLHVPEDDNFRAIVASRRLKPFLLGSPGAHWLIVRRETRKELAAALKELGFTLDSDLTIQERKPFGNKGRRED
jgi:hypothetical protein